MKAEYAFKNITKDALALDVFIFLAKVLGIRNYSVYVKAYDKRVQESLINKRCS